MIEFVLGHLEELAEIALGHLMSDESEAVN